MKGLDKQRLFMPDFPKIVCLCGSTRFMEAFQEANLRETMDGNIVLSVGCNTKSDAELFTGKHGGEFGALKTRLDELHKRKIDLADEILVLNVDGYIGDSTRSEIEYAEAHGKPVRYLEGDKNAVSAIYAQRRGHSEEPPEDQIKYERDMLLMLILDESEYGEGAFDRAVEKLKRPIPCDCLYNQDSHLESCPNNKRVT